MLTPKRRNVLQTYFLGKITTAQAVRTLNTTRERFNTLKDMFAKEELQKLWSNK